MARTGNNYEKWLWGDNSINIQGRIIVNDHCPSPYCPIYLYTKFDLNANNNFKVFARQGTGQTDGQSGDYMLPLGEHKKKD